MLSGEDKLPPEVRQWLLENTQCAMMVWYSPDGERNLTAVVRNDFERDALIQGFRHILDCNTPTYVKEHDND